MQIKLLSILVLTLSTYTMHGQTLASMITPLNLKATNSIPGVTGILITQTHSKPLRLEVERIKELLALKDREICFIIFEKYNETSKQQTDGKLLQLMIGTKVVYFEPRTDTLYYHFYGELDLKTITYNGSDDPNICIEAVDHGLYVFTPHGKQFFNLPYGIWQKLKQEDPSTIYRVKVAYYDPIRDGYYESGAAGSIMKIFNGEKVLYDAYKAEE